MDGILGCREMLARSCEVGRVESTQRVRVIISWRKTRDKDEGARNTARERVPMHSERRKYKSPEQALRETERAGEEAEPHQPQQQLFQRRQKAETTEA